MTVEVRINDLHTCIESLKISDISDRYLNEGIILAYAAESARSVEEVSTASIGFVSQETNLIASRICLTAMRFDQNIRCVGVIRYYPEIIEICRDMLMEICSFHREREPPGGRFIDWGVVFCCEKIEEVPDVIYDTGTREFTGLIRFFGSNPAQVSGSINRILTRINNTNI